MLNFNYLLFEISVKTRPCAKVTYLPHAACFVCCLARQPHLALWDLPIALHLIFEHFIVLLSFRTRLCAVRNLAFIRLPERQDSSDRRAGLRNDKKNKVPFIIAVEGLCLNFNTCRPLQQVNGAFFTFTIV